MQMQSPIFLGFILIITFLFALNSLGLFDINLGITQSGQTTQNVYKEALIDGVFITLISTPCSAPILGTAIAAALASDGHWWETLLLFWSIGFGLALPVMAISYLPGLAKKMPRMGEWNEHFKHLVGISLLAASVWLWGLFENITPLPIRLITLGSFCLISSLFIWRSFNQKEETAQKKKWILGVWLTGAGYIGLHSYVEPQQAHQVLYTLCLFGSALVFPQLWKKRSKGVQWILNGFLIAAIGWSLYASTHRKVEILKWQPFTPSTLAQAQKEGKAVFVDFTADWCINCKLFEKTYLNRSSTAQLFKDYNVIPLKADLTKNDDSLWALLSKHGKNGLPVYFLYSSQGELQVLPDGPPLTLKSRIRALK
jgi:thiol:disulfide interchange protein DsbD